MYRSLTSLMVFVLIVAAGAPAAIGPAAAQDVTLTVTVQDPGGQTIPNADLTASWDGGQTTETTRSNGQALIDVPEGADVEITVSHPDFVRNHPVTVNAASSRDVTAEVALSSQAEITVQDSNGGVADAKVRLLQNSRIAGSKMTAADGKTTIEPVERGDYTLRVTKPGYYDYSRSITVDGETKKTVPISTGSVKATFAVSDDHFDPPKKLENAKVELTQLGTTLTTLSDGNADTSVPVNRNYNVKVSKSGYNSVTQTVRVRESDKSVEINAERTNKLHVSAANKQVVVDESTRITVTDEYGDPVEGATVRRGGSDVGQTNADGEFDVAIAQSGNVDVEVAQDGESASVAVEGITTGADATPTAEETDEPEDTDEPEETGGDSGPGFGLVAAVMAIAALAGVARRRSPE